MEKAHTVHRQMGLVSSVATMTGCIIGASVFVVPGQLSSTSGPNAWISYLLGAVLTLFSCLVYAQVGSAIPVSSANYRLCVACVNDTYAFIYDWCYLCGYSFLFPIMAKTAASYLTVFLPSLKNQEILISIGFVVITGGLNLLGTSLSSKLQTILVIILFAVIIVFSAGGTINADWTHFRPLFPKGVSPVIIGVISTYYAFAGSNNIIEMAGDIKNPGKNIPRTLFISMAIIILLYVGMCVSLVAILPWQDLGDASSTIDAASKIFPAWFGKCIAIAAIAACWTTLNAVFGAMSRVLMVLGKTGIIPSSFSKINKKGVPHTALVLITLLGSLFCAFYASIMRFVNISSLYALLMAALVAIAFLRMKSRMPKEYSEAPYKKSGVQYYLWPVLTIISSALFIILEFINDTFFAAMAIVIIPFGLGLYVLRKKKIEGQGLGVEEIILNDMHDEEMR